MDEAQTQEIHDYGKRIGFFLDQLDVPASLKQVLIELLPTFTLEQIEELRIRLEEQVIEQTAIELTPEFQQKMTEVNNETSGELDALLTEIK